MTIPERKSAVLTSKNIGFHIGEDAVGMPREMWLAGVTACTVIHLPSRHTVWIEFLEIGTPGLGIGLAMADVIERWARFKNADWIRGESRIDAFGFWRKAGFTLGAIQPNGRRLIAKTVDRPYTAGHTGGMVFGR